MSERVKDICIEIAAWIGAACFYGGIAFLLYGCKSIEYVPVETVRTERVEAHDTVEIGNSTARSDSTTTETKTLLQKVDSAYLALLGIVNAPKEAWLLQTTTTTKQKTTEQEYHQDKRRQSSDSVRTKVIQVPYPVERKLTKWETFCLDYGKVMTGCTIALLATFIFLVIRWFTGRKRST